MCLIPLTLLSQQRKVHAWLQLGRKMSVGKCLGTRGPLIWAGCGYKIHGERARDGMTSSILHFHSDWLALSVESPKSCLCFSFIHSIRLEASTLNLKHLPSHPHYCPRNSTAVFVITSSALIDVCGDLLIFHEFLLCFNWAASPTACVNCSEFAPERRQCEQRVCVFVDGKKERKKNATNFHRKALDQLHLSSKQ